MIASRVMGDSLQNNPLEEDLDANSRFSGVFLDWLILYDL